MCHIVFKAYYGNLPAEVVLDLASLDGIRGIVMDDLGELYGALAFYLSVSGIESTHV